MKQNSIIFTREAVLKLRCDLPNDLSSLTTNLCTLKYLKLKASPQQMKIKILTVALENRKTSPLRHYLEKPILLNFMKFSTIVSPRL